MNKKNKTVSSIYVRLLTNEDIPGYELAPTVIVNRPVAFNSLR